LNFSNLRAGILTGQYGMKEYLKLPVQFGGFFEKKKLATCSLLDSVYRNLHLLITTMPGENKMDDSFGSEFWENDYDIHLSNDSRKEIVISSLKKQIQLYEKRITDISVDVNVRLSNINLKGVEIQRRKLEITINGKMVRSMEPFTFQTGFFIGPLTLD